MLDIRRIKANLEDIKKAMNVGSEIAAETLKHYGGF